MPTVVLPYQVTKTLLLAFHELQKSVPITNQVYYRNLTLNAKYGNLPTDLPVAEPKIRYFGIGINGFKNIDDGNGGAPYIPKSSNLDLYQPIPFKIVPIGADLSVEDRAQYRMRVQQSINGNQYYCYYLKALTVLTNSVDIITTNVNTGEETVGDGELNEDNLTPTPTDTVLEGTVSDTYETNVSITCEAVITGKEVIDSINILFGGDPNLILKSRISEIGLYAGEDKVIDTATNVKEAIYTFLGYHRTSLGTDFENPLTTSKLKFKLSSANSFLS